MKDKTYGYEIVEGKLRVCKSEAKVVRSIFEYLMNDVTTYRIANLLNEENVETRKKNGRWTHSRISQMIRNKRYSGELGYPLIIRKQIQKQAIEKLESNSRARCRLTNSKNNNESPFYKKMKCAECGYRLCLHETNGIKYWRCSSNMLSICNLYHKWDGVFDEEIYDTTMKMMNELVQDLNLIKNTGTKQLNHLEIVKIDNQIKEKMNHSTFDVKEIEKLFIQKYDLKYRQLCTDHAMETIQLQLYLKQLGKISRLNHEIVNKVIRKMEITKEEKIIYTLWNYQKIEKAITIVREIHHG